MRHNRSTDMVYDAELQVERPNLDNVLINEGFDKPVNCIFLSSELISHVQAMSEKTTKEYRNTISGTELVAG